MDEFDKEQDNRQQYEDDAKPQGDEVAKEMAEFNDALRGLRDKVDESNKLAWNSLRTIDNVLNKSHLKGTLTLMQSDFTLKRLLDNAN